MLYRNTRSVFTVVAFLFAMVLTIPSWSQHTFRGGINGVVTDQSGAVVPGASGCHERCHERDIDYDFELRR